MSWINKIDKSITERLEEFQIKLLSEDELEELELKVIEFYNNPPKDKDVFRLEDGSCILLLTTPPKITDKKGNVLNKPKLCDNGAYRMWCNILIYGKSVSSGVFGNKKQWQEIGSFNSKAIVKAKLAKEYKMLSDTGYGKSLDQFLKDNDLNSLEDIDEADYLIKYTVNIQQVIT